MRNLRQAIPQPLRGSSLCTREPFFSRDTQPPAQPKVPPIRTSKGQSSTAPEYPTHSIEGTGEMPKRGTPLGCSLVLSRSEKEQQTHPACFIRECNPLTPKRKIRPPGHIIPKAGIFFFRFTPPCASSPAGRTAAPQQPPASIHSGGTPRPDSSSRPGSRPRTCPRCGQGRRRPSAARSVRC